MTQCDNLTMEQVEFLDKCLKLIHNCERKGKLREYVGKRKEV
jgi:predicted RNA-binding protein